MPLSVPVSQGNVPEVEDGTYPILITGVGEKMLENDQYGNPHKALLICQFPDLIDEATGEFIALDAMCNFVISEKSTLTRWLTAAGMEINFDEDEIDIEEVVGREALAVVAHKDGKGWPRITDLMPPLKRGGVATRTAAGKSATNPAASPAVILPDGSADFTVFWTVMRAHGINRKNVADHLDGDIESLLTMDGPAVAELMDLLTGKAQGGSIE